MSQLLINYSLNSTTVKNPDGSYVGTVTNCKAVAGPGATPYGSFAQVLEFIAGCKISTAVQATAVDKEQFTASIVFKPKASTLGMQTLVDCSALPFSIWVQPASVAPAAVGVQVKSSGNGLAITDSFLRTTDLNMAGWNKIDLVYDRDTLALVLNGKLVGVTGLPNGALSAATGAALVLGQSVSGTMQFTGQMAAFTFTKGIPADLTALILNARTQPEWLISRKYMAVKDKYSFGNLAEAVKFDAAIPAYVKKWAGGCVIAPIGTGTAYEVHGLIYAAYKADTTLAGKLGIPLSDEIDGGVAGVRKNLFTKGGIYFSDATGAVPMYGVMYADYESIGGAQHIIGLPTKAEAAIAGGRVQDFQRGQMFKSDGTTAAFEVHGLIWEEFKKLGGILHCGFPLHHEEAVLNANNVEIARMSQFQLGSIYYHPSTGAREVRGEILRTYLRAGGMNSTLGFPTSNELAVPGLTGGKANTFQRGTIVSGNGKTRIACPFNFYVGRIVTIESENDGSQNDPIVRVIVKENATEAYSKRFPENGYTNEKNIVELNAKTGIFYPNDINKTYTLSVHCQDYDNAFNGGNDELGTFTKVLNAQNCWGRFESEDGLFESGQVSKIKNISWAVQGQVPADYTADFWKPANKPTLNLTLEQGAMAIRDIDSTPEWWDPFDAVDQLFFNNVIKKAGLSGNCYGMSVYGLKSWNGQTRHVPPLQQYLDTPVLWDEFRVHQARQFGDKMVGWTIDTFTNNQTQDPKGAFTRSRNAWNKGDKPVLSFTDTANLLKAKGHCVLPFKWDDSTPIWKITVFDPNLGGGTREFLIDSVQNTWSYAGLGWSGGFKKGGRLFHAPATIVTPRPRTPYWAVLGRVPDMISYFFNNLVETLGFVDDQGNSADMSDVADPNATNTDKKYLPIPTQNSGDGFNGSFLVCPSGGKLSSANLQALAATTKPNWSTLNLGAGFTHRMIGKGRGNENVSLCMTHHLSKITVDGLIDPGESLSFSARNFNSPDRLITIQSGKARTFSLTVNTQFGIQGDAIAIQFSIPTKANVDTKIMLDPSMSRIDLLTAGTALPMVINVSGRIGGVTYRRVIEAIVDGGTRFDFQNVLQTGVVTGGRIDSLRGNLIKEIILRAK